MRKTRCTGPSSEMRAMVLALLASLLTACSTSGSDDTVSVEPPSPPADATTPAPTEGGPAPTEGGGLPDTATPKPTDGSVASDTTTPSAACPAAQLGDTALGKDTPPPSPRWKVADAITFQNVGGTGSYSEVTSMAPGVWPPPCADANACVKATKNVSGPIVPFDEEMTMVFSGPIDLFEIAAYEPAGSDFARVSHWDPCGSDNLVFMNNLGGGSASGVWTVCGGNSQSYASADGAKAEKAPVQFAGHLADGVGVNVMTASACGADCGFYRDVGLHGWKGSQDGTKILAVKMRMPVGQKTPAYWILPAQVVRTAQYGCNCRGMGGAGGCGELDVAEVLVSEDPMAATTTIYSFKSVRNGGGSTFQRPAAETATFVVVFDGAAGTISLRRLAATSFDFGPAIAASVVDAWKANVGAVSSM
jgi:hypothetical protein